MISLKTLLNREHDLIEKLNELDRAREVLIMKSLDTYNIYEWDLLDSIISDYTIQMCDLKKSIQITQRLLCKKIKEMEGLL